MMWRGLAICVATATALAPTQPLALSCNEYSIRHAYWSYQEATETYMLVLGSFADPRPAFPGDNSRADIFIARFIGQKASRRGFDQPFETDVTLFLPDLTIAFEADEAGNLISDYDPAEYVKKLMGEAGLIWLEQTAEGYQAEHGLCWPLIDSDPESVQPALDCLAGRSCPIPD
jgi:hypothetical protein